MNVLILAAGSPVHAQPETTREAWLLMSLGDRKLIDYVMDLAREVATPDEIFVVVDAAEDVERCLRAAESVTGDLDAPHTGLFAAWPLAMVKGAWSPSIALQPDEGANEETPSSDAASLADGEDDDAGDNELEGAA